VPIRASNNFWGAHIWLEWGKDNLKAFMIELVAEFLKSWLLSLALAR